MTGQVLLMPNYRLLFKFMTASLASCAAALLLMHAMVPFVTPAMDLDFLVLAYG